MESTKKTLLTVAAAMAMGAAVHPSAVLKSPSTSADAGSTIELRGEEFLPGTTTTLMLRGPLAEYELRDVTAGEDGTFRIDLAIPYDVRPGQYRIVALASDGDVSASLDLTVTAANLTAGDEPVRGDEDRGHDEMADGGARADEIPIERSRAGIEWGLIGLLIGLAGGGGAALLKRS